jgi:hypothetical protein
MGAAYHGFWRCPCRADVGAGGESGRTTTKASHIRGGNGHAIPWGRRRLPRCAWRPPPCHLCCVRVFVQRHDHRRDGLDVCEKSQLPGGAELFVTR